MPSGLERRYGTHKLHFVTCSCYQRRPFLDDDRIKQTFLSILEESRKSYKFYVAGYVLMPEHFHLLISEPEIGDPGTVLQVLKQRVSHQGLRLLHPTLSGWPILSRHLGKGGIRKDGAPTVTTTDSRNHVLHPTLSQTMGKDGAPKISRHFWQTRFYDFNVWSYAKKIEKLKYMHRNPVKRGLVSRPEDWPWSSFRHYALGEIGTVEIESEWTALRREREVHVLQIPTT